MPRALVAGGAGFIGSHMVDLLLGPDCTWADIGKMSRCLGWKSLVPFEEGVGRMLADLGAWASAPVWTPESIEAATGTWFRYLSKRG